MLDPRIYRTGFVAVVLAVIVLAFSLTDQAGPQGATLAPNAFSGQNVMASIDRFGRDYPDRRPGSTGDDALAADVGSGLRELQGFSVSTRVFHGRTIDGPRTLETVTAMRAGLSAGSIVIVAHRDSRSSPGKADLSGTATLVELGRVLSGETLHRTVALVSTSGSAGAVGATQLARSLAGPVDAVIALGDLAAARVHGPVVVPWSNGQDVAPPALRNTLALALRAQAGLPPGGSGLTGQLAHLAFPLTLSEQGPFGARGMPAVLVSASGERGPSGGEPVSSARATAMGRSVLQAITALDSGGGVPRARSYLLYQGKVVPAWAVRLLVLALIVPVLGATVDGLARARRRGHSILRWTAWVLASGVPFVLALIVVLGSRAVGWLAAAPPGPVAAGAVPLRGFGVVLIGLLTAMTVLWFLPVGPFARRSLAGAGDGTELAIEGPGAALLLVMCVTTVALWAANPFAALLVVPALHLWMWVADPEVQVRPAVTVALLLAGLAAPVLLIVYYAQALAWGPFDVLWNGLLMVAGGHVAIATAIEWSVLLGCVASVLTIAARRLRETGPEEAPITVRGPITYAGPGSLGGTRSALRR